MKSSITTWEDVYNYIKKKKVVDRSELTKVFGLNLGAKLKSLRANRCIEILSDGRTIKAI